MRSLYRPLLRTPKKVISLFEGLWPYMVISKKIDLSSLPKFKRIPHVLWQPTLEKQIKIPLIVSYHNFFTLNFAQINTHLLLLNTAGSAYCDSFIDRRAKWVYCWMDGSHYIFHHCGWGHSHYIIGVDVPYNDLTVISWGLPRFHC